MATCETCGSTIVFGPVRDGDRTFCNKTCRARAPARSPASVPEELVSAEVRRIHAEHCPRCNGAGPVDLHESMYVWSAIVITKYGTERQLSCRPCGRRKQALSLAGCAVAGWWGIPFGLIFTPLAIVTNLAKLAGGPRPDAPSPQLVQLVRQSLARRAA